MSQVFESLSLNGLRLAHLRQLLTYIRYAKDERFYYGNKAQFDKRHRDLEEWIGSAVMHAQYNDVIFPNRKKSKRTF